MTGNLTLGGKLNVTDAGGFGIGVYRLFNYGGTLTNGIMTIGTVPSGVTPGALTIQTSVANQVNLVVSGTSLLEFWDGPNVVENGAVTGGTGTWDNTTTNWTVADGSSNSAWKQGFAVFEGTAGTVTLAQNVTMAGLQFVTNGYLITSSNSSMITAAAGTILEANTGVSGTIGVPIVGAGDVTAAGPGTVILAAANTYTGGTTISGGILQLGNGGTAGSVVGAIVNNGTLALDRSDAGMILSGVISGSGTLVQIGTGTSILTGANTYSGGTTINAGTIQLGNAGITGSIAGNVTDNGVLQFNRTDAGLNLAGNISGTGSVVQAGTGTVTLSGTNTYSGVTTVSAGTLQAGSVTALSSFSDFTVTSALNLGGFSNAIGSLAGSGTVTNTGAAATLSAGGDNASSVFSGTLQNGSGILGLTKIGIGTLTLSGINTYSALTMVSAGTLQAGSGGALSAASDFIVNSILNMGGFSNAIGSLAGSGIVTDTGTAATLSAGGDNASSVFSGVLQNGPGALALTKTGTGTLTLSGTNTYSGPTTVSAGTLQAGSGGALSPNSDFTVTSILNMGGFSNTVGSLAGSGTVTNTGAGATLSAGADNTSSVFSGMLQNGPGALGLTKSGTGTLTLTGSNIYMGGTTISTGILQLGNATATGSIVGNITDNAVFQFNRTDTALNLAGNISGAGSVVQAGTGTVTLSGINTYSGVTTVSAGTLQAGSLSALSANSDFTVSGAILNLSGFSNTIGSLAGTGTVTTGAAATLTVGDNFNTTFSGVLQNGTGALALTKVGIGTLTLSGPNTYSGATTVSAGTLQAGSTTALSATSDFTVNSILRPQWVLQCDRFSGRQRHHHQFGRRGDVECGWG